VTKSESTQTNPNPISAKIAVNAANKPENNAHTNHDFDICMNVSFWVCQELVSAFLLKKLILQKESIKRPAASVNDIMVIDSHFGLPFLTASNKPCSFSMSFATC
jgi:hypothetical protein